MKRPAIATAVFALAFMFGCAIAKDPQPEPTLIRGTDGYLYRLVRKAGPQSKFGVVDAELWEREGEPGVFYFTDLETPPGFRRVTN